MPSRDIVVLLLFDTLYAYWSGTQTHSSPLSQSIFVLGVVCVRLCSAMEDEEPQPDGLFIAGTRPPHSSYITFFLHSGYSSTECKL